MAGVVDEILEARLSETAARGLLRALPRPPAEAVHLCSNDYLGLAHDANFRKRAMESLARRDVSLGATGSRLISGNFSAHEELEVELASWLGAESALIFASGYQAAGGLLSALLREGDFVVSDALNHASTIDGIRLSRATRVVTPHRDVSAVEAALRDAPQTGLRLVVTESVFSMDGHLAPLAELCEICESYGAALIVDEAHALGVLGPEGRGLVSQSGLEKKVLARVGTFGKAFGGGGAFVATSSLVRRILVNHARSFVFSTALSPILVEIARLALPEVRAGIRQQRLWQTVHFLADVLQRHDLWSGTPQSAIFPLIVGDANDVQSLSAELLGDGFFVQGIRPPTVPAGTSRLRFTACAHYGEQMLERFVQSLAKHSRNLAPPMSSHEC